MFQRDMLRRTAFWGHECWISQRKGEYPLKALFAKVMIACKFCSLVCGNVIGKA